MAPPATQVSPEEKRQRRLLTTVITLNSVSVLLLAGALTISGVLMLMKLNQRVVKVEDPKRMPGPQRRIDDSIFNLGEPNAYVKAALQIELNVEDLPEKEQPAFLDEARARLPEIKDLVISELSGKTYREVSTPEGKDQLKEELRVKINALLSRGEVKQIMFTSFAAQR